MRLSGRRAFASVFAGKVRKTVGPLTVHSLPNDRSHPRLGLTVSRSVGTAVKRNQIKRLLREAFRLMQHDWPWGYDVVVVVRPHATLTLAEYQKAFFTAMRSVHQRWSER